MLLNFQIFDLLLFIKNIYIKNKKKTKNKHRTIDSYFK